MQKEVDHPDKTEVQQLGGYVLPDNGVPIK
jgi:hypothetical protein